MIRALADAWAGQPDLSITQLLMQVENHHGGPGASDEEFLHVCQALASRYMARLPNGADFPVDAAYYLRTCSAEVIVNAQSVAILREGSAPSMWRYNSVGSAEVGNELVLVDSNLHRYAYGRVKSIRPAGTNNQLVKTSECIALISATGSTLWFQGRRATEILRLRDTPGALALGEVMMLGGRNCGIVQGLMSF
ncbi:hypothetical protein CGERO_09335 [Corynebacterium gerontici]|uniref:Uncharacterized protein n=1 Tax=Corynebacterium gerontici TaxID=2079234 RepID=A0A3G6J5F7_9CORY|nr:hypothetical protein CGERO_09335 [Corynebacterium gerontici]